MPIPEFEAIGMELVLMSLTSYPGFNTAVNAVSSVLDGEAGAGSQAIVARSSSEGI